MTMTREQFLNMTLSLAAGGVAVAACGDDETGGNGGAGGTPSTGGNPSTGGSPATGGTGGTGGRGARAPDIETPWSDIPPGVVGLRWSAAVPE